MIILFLNTESSNAFYRNAPTNSSLEALDEARLQLFREEAELEISISGISVQVPNSSI